MTMLLRKNLPQDIISPLLRLFLSQMGHQGRNGVLLLFNGGDAAAGHC